MFSPGCIWTHPACQIRPTLQFSILRKLFPSRECLVCFTLDAVRCAPCASSTDLQGRNARRVQCEVGRTLLDAVLISLRFSFSQNTIMICPFVRMHGSLLVGDTRSWCIGKINVYSLRTLKVTSLWRRFLTRRCDVRTRPEVASFQ